MGRPAQRMPRWDGPYPTHAMENLTAAELVRYSVALGGRGLVRGGGSEAARRVWMPLDIDRVAELPWTGRMVTAAAPTDVLDLASPKLLALWLAHTLQRLSSRPICGRLRSSGGAD